MRILPGNLLFALALLSATIPAFYSADFLYGFITYKSLVFRSLVAVSLLAWGISCLFDASLRPRFTFLTVGWTMLVLWLTLCAWLGSDFSRSLWSSLERMDGLVGYAWLTGYLWFLSSVLTSSRRWFLFFGTSCLVAAVLAVLALTGIPEWYAPNQRLFLTFGNPTLAALYFGMHLFFLLGLAIQAVACWPGLRRKIFGTAAVLCGIFGYIIYLTDTRIVLGLALFSAIGYGVFFAVEKYRFGKIRLLPARLSLVLLCLGFIVYSDALLLFFQQFLNRRSTWQPRLDTWRFAKQAIFEHPLLGWGPENFDYALASSYHTLIHSDELWYDRTHNIFLEWGIGGGLPALLGFAALMGIGFWRVFDRRQKGNQVNTLIFGAALAFFLLVQQFSPDSLITYLCLFWTLSYIEQLAPSQLELGIPTSRVAYWAIPIMFCIALLFIKTVPPAFRVSQYLLRALQSSQVSYGISTARQLFQSYSGYRQDIAELLAVNSHELVTKAFDEKERNWSIQTIDSLLATEVKQKVKNAKLVSIYGNFLLNQGRLVEANKASAKAVALTPNRAESYIQYGVVLLRENKYSQAKTAFNYALQLHPNLEKVQILNLVCDGLAGDRRRLWSGMRQLRLATANNYVDQLYYACSAGSNLDLLVRYFNKHLLPTHSQALPKAVYACWATAAYKTGNLASCRSALFSYGIFYVSNNFKTVNHFVNQTLQRNQGDFSMLVQ
jgi:O-antigen ligase